MSRARARPTALALALALGSVALAIPRTAAAHDVTAPKPKTQAPPVWPTPPERHDVVVPVVLSVGPDGRVEDATVEGSVAPAFDEAALVAARTWTFEPATRDGKPVTARIRALVRFAGASAAAPEVPTVVAPPVAASAPEPRVDAVKVTGTAPPRSASETVRGRDVIGAAPHRTASDAMSVVPGVFVTQHSGEGKAHQIFLRGFDAVHGQDLELWVGGIPVNEVSNVHGQGYADLHYVMPEVIRDITAQPGTYDPRQGDFAVAGSLRMRLGYPEAGATAKGTIGTFGTRRLFLAYHPKDASEETFAAFETYQTDGFGPNRAARRASAIAQATHDFSDGTSLRVLGSTSTGRFDSAGVVLASDVESGRIDRLATYDPKQGGFSTRTQVLVELHRDDESARWSVAPFVVFRTLHLRQNFTGYLTDALRSGADRLDTDNTQQRNESVTVGMTGSYRKALPLLSKRDALEVGVFGRHDLVEQSQRRLSATTDRATETLVDANVRGTNVAGYADLALHPLSRLALRGGVRADALSYAAEDAAAGSALPGPARAAQGTHLGKKATADLTVHRAAHLLASYGEGFRSPQARSLSDGERTFFTEVRSFELGARVADGQRIAASLAAFHTRLTEDLVFDPVTARNERVPGSSRTGLAADLIARPAPGFVLASSATYTRAVFTGTDAVYGQGDLLPYVPQLVLRSDASYKRTLTRAFGRDLEGRVGAGLEGLARRPLPYGEMGQNVFLVDLSAGLRLREVELGIDVFNALDAAWYDGQFVYASNFAAARTPSRIPVRHVTIGPPRTVFASLTLYL